jgi:hypothetical protein
VARYLAGDFATALTELQAYRRMTGRTDQNHLIADCLRGLDREIERVSEPVEAMLEDAKTPVDRQDEGVIVWAGALADDGQLPAARALVRRRLQHRPASTTEAVLASRLRLLVFAADLAHRDGDDAAARRYRAQIAAAAPELQEEVGAPDDDRPGTPDDAPADDDTPGSSDAAASPDATTGEHAEPGSLRSERDGHVEPEGSVEQLHFDELD